MLTTIEAPAQLGGQCLSADGTLNRACTLARWALDNCPYRQMSRLDCQVIDGVLILSGVVPTYYLKQLAQELLLRLDNGTPIDNRVEVSAGQTPCSN